MKNSSRRDQPNKPIWLKRLLWIVGAGVITAGGWLSGWEQIARTSHTAWVFCFANDGDSVKIETRPFHVNPDDRDVVRFATFDLRKDTGQFVTAGSWPAKPSVRVKVKELNSTGEHPSITVTISGRLDNFEVDDDKLVFEVPLIRTAGFRLKHRTYDIIFEIVDDSFYSVSGRLAIYKGSAISDGIGIDNFVPE